MVVAVCLAFWLLEVGGVIISHFLLLRDVQINYIDSIIIK